MIATIIVIAIAVLTACGESTAPAPSSTDDAGEETPQSTPDGDLFVSFSVLCQDIGPLPVLVIAVEATATGAMTIDHIRVFHEGIQALEREVENELEFSGEFLLPVTLGEHQIRVSVEGTSIQRVAQPQEISCSGASAPPE